MTDDPREILKAAGAECEELDTYFEIDYEFLDKQWWEITDDAHDAFLALARLVAKQAEQLARLAPKGGPDSRVTTGPGCEHGPWRTYPGGGGT